MNNSQSAVDIVVPVYNGYEDLVRCVESLKRYTDLLRHRVIFIDDCSTDERIRPYIEQVCSTQERAKAQPGSTKQSGRREYGFTCVFNEQNQGFSANVNLGLSWSDRDTILLNSDTVVTRNWVEKLASCAYSSERIGTVTPLSNAATLASVPVFLKDNRIPEGFTVDSYAQLCERVSLHRYPRITVAVGFCMFVKNEAFEETGPFDAKTFRRGYGEENDFCFRCEMAGFIHVLCDDTFVYHKGTASFASEEKQRLTGEHEKILRERYPGQMKANDRYCADNPDQEIRDNLMLYQMLENGKMNLLYALHLDFREIARNSIGGTQLHVKDLVSGAREDYNVFVLSRDGSELCLTIYPAYGSGGKAAASGSRDRNAAVKAAKDITQAPVSLKFPIGDEEPFPVYYDEKLARTMREILTAFRIGLVHIHHTQGISLDLFRVCRELHIPAAVTLHDYFYACPATKLIRPDGRFCPACRDGVWTQTQEKVCGPCLKKNCGFGHVHVIDRWRNECLRALESCSRLIFPTKSAMDVMLGAYPSLKEKSLVIGHGTDYVTEAGEELSIEKSRIIRSGQVHSRLDQKPGTEGGFHYISGWVYYQGEDSEASPAAMEVTDHAGNTYYVEARKTARPDVAAAAADPAYLWSGIHFVFDVPGMAQGTCRIRLLVQKDGNWYTEGAVYTGAFREVIADAAERRLNVAFLGGVTPAKGSKLLAETIRSGDRRFNFFVFGQIGDPNVFVPENSDNVFFTGVYRREDIFDLLRIGKIDVACILPIWAETFCYTLSEAWAAGIPAVGSSLGAVGERIRRTGAGWTIAPDTSVDKLLELLGKIRSDRNELAEKKAAASSLHLKSVADMNSEYRELYRSIAAPDACGVAGSFSAADAKESGSADRDFIFQGLALANPSVTGRGGAASLNRLREENDMLRSSMEMLRNTTAYRFSRKIADANIPFKEPLKRLLKKRAGRHYE